MEYRRALFCALFCLLFILTILMSILIAMCRIFADDANVFTEVSSLDKAANLQSDLDELYR